MAELCGNDIAFSVFAQHSLDMVEILVCECVVDKGMEVVVEIRQQGAPLQLSGGDAVEVVLDPCREIVIHDAGKVLYKEICNYYADFLGQEFSFFGSDNLRPVLFAHRISFQFKVPDLYLPAFLVSFHYVTPSGGKCRNGGGVGGRPSDA